MQHENISREVHLAVVLLLLKFHIDIRIVFVFSQKSLEHDGERRRNIKICQLVIYERKPDVSEHSRVYDAYYDKYI